MNAGRELDALIAEKVLGFKWDESRCRVCGWPLDPPDGPGCHLTDCSMRPRPKRRSDEPMSYSTNIVYAWLIAEMLHMEVACHGTDYRASCADPFGSFFVSRADTAPLAICLAALKSVEERG